MYKKRIIRAVKLKLYPTYKQKQKIELFIGGDRWIWNYFLQLQKINYEQRKPFLNAYFMHSIFRRMMSQDEYCWLKTLHSHSVAATTRKLELAFSNFFTNIKNGKKPGYPRFKSKKDTEGSFTYPDENRIKGNKILLSKIGYVRARGFRTFKNEILKQVVVKRTNIEEYEAIYYVECDNCSEVATGKIKSIGIDVGVNKFLADSNGKIIHSLNLKKEIYNIKTLQQQLEKENISKIRKEKIRLLISKLYRKIANKRTNWLHHVANQYLKYRNVYVEDLNIKQMTKNISGTIENPNMDSKSKSRLNNLILQQSWSRFFTILKYKIEDKKGIFYAVDPMFTSQQCSKCNYVNKLSRNGVCFRCINCNNEMDADHNAAINILNKGYSDLHLASMV